MKSRINFYFLLLIIFPGFLFAQAPEPIGVRLTHLEMGQKAIHQCIDEVSKRMDDVNKPSMMLISALMTLLNVWISVSMTCGQI